MKKQPDELKWNENLSQMGFSLDFGRKEVSIVYWPCEKYKIRFGWKKKKLMWPLGLIVINHCECCWSKYCICAVSNCIKIILLLLEKPIKKSQNCHSANVNKSVCIVHASPKSSSSAAVCDVAVGVRLHRKQSVCFWSNCVKRQAASEYCGFRLPQ